MSRPRPEDFVPGVREAYARLMIDEAVAIAELVARPTDAAYDAALDALVTRSTYALLVLGLDPEDDDEDDE